MHIPKWFRYSLKTQKLEACTNDEILNYYHLGKYEEIYKRMATYVFKVNGQLWYETPTKNLSLTTVKLRRGERIDG